MCCVHNRKINGMTLVEVMISIVIALLLITMLTKIYMSLQHRMVILATLQQHQKKAQQVNELLSYAVHRAGQAGCRVISDSLSVKDKSLFVSYQEFPVAIIIKPVKSRKLMYLDVGTWFHNKDILVISDCERAEIARVGRVSIEHDYQIVVTVEPLRFKYERFAEAGKLVKQQFYTDKDLLMRDINNKEFRLVNGVGNLRFNSDNKGVFVEFDTFVNRTSKHWNAYYAAA